jgi:hypothetical protein
MFLLLVIFVTLLLLLLLCDVPTPFTSNPMAPSYDVPLVYASWQHLLK